MKTLEKKNISKIDKLTNTDLEKVLLAKENYKNSGKSYTIEEAYKLGLSKLKF